MRKTERKQRDPNKIYGKEKAAFLCGNIGNIPVMTLINGYLLIFYTDVCGMDPYAIGTLFLITKLLDGINDPIMGFLIDHMKVRKMGHFRPVLLIGSVVCSLNYLLLWLGPAYLPDALKLVVAYISYILIGITFDLMDIPLNSLIPVMTNDEKERNGLSLIKGVGYILGGIVFSIIPPLIISSGNDQRFAYTILVFVAVAMVLLFSVTCALGVKERIQPLEGQSYKLKELFSILTFAPVLVMFLVGLIYGIGSGIHMATGTYFATYVIGDISVLSVVNGASMLGLFPAMILAPILSNRISKHYIYGGGIMLAGIGCLIRLLDINNVGLWIFGTVLTGVGSGILATILYSIQADNCDYVEYRANVRAEGAVSSLNSFITKAAQGIGGALPAYILGWTGFVANQTQTESAMGGIVFSAIILPGIMILGAGLVMIIFYPLNRKNLSEMRKELEKRH